MYSLESKNLILFPLSADHLEWLITDFKKLEQAFNLKESGFSLNSPDPYMQELKGLLSGAVISQVKDHSDHYMWYTYWLVIEKKSKIPVGGIWFNGEPDIYGKVFLGYFIEKSREGRGYATEIVACLKEWSLGKNSLKMIVADTSTNHKASQKVLKKNGFKEIEKSIETSRWAYKRS